MVMKAQKKKVRVTVMSYDRWSGPEILWIKEFAYRKNAEKYCKKHNAGNTESVVSDYYTVARID
jgi:hypothetical protein